MFWLLRLKTGNKVSGFLLPSHRECVAEEKFMENRIRKEIGQGAVILKTGDQKPYFFHLNLNTLLSKIN